MRLDRPLRVLLLSQWFSPEPEGSRGLPFARWMQQRGHDVTVLTGFPNYPTGVLYPGYRLQLHQEERIDGVRVCRVPLYPNHDRSGFRRMLNYLSFAASATALGMPRHGAVDVVYGMSTPPTIAIPALANHLFRSVPYVFNIADMWPEAVLGSGMVRDGASAGMLRAGILGMCDVVYRDAAFITAISRGYRRQLIERGLPPHRVHAVHNWVDEELYVPKPFDPQLAAQLGLTGRFNFLYGGNFGPFQGIDTLIRAAARLKHIPEIQLALVGTGQHEDSLRQLARDLDATNVRFTGRVDQSIMPNVYSLADVLVMHLNDSEFLRATVPSKTQVYLAMGRPMIIAASGESAEIVAESGGGVVTPPQDAEALAAAMLDLYRRSPEQRAELAARGREYYFRTMSLERGGATIEALLARAAAREA